MKRVVVHHDASDSEDEHPSAVVSDLKPIRGHSLYVSSVDVKLVAQPFMDVDHLILTLIDYQKARASSTVRFKMFLKQRFFDATPRLFLGEDKSFFAKIERERIDCIAKRVQLDALIAQSSGTSAHLSSADLYKLEIESRLRMKRVVMSRGRTTHKLIGGTNRETHTEMAAALAMAIMKLGAYQQTCAKNKSIPPSHAPTHITLPTREQTLDIYFTEVNAKTRVAVQKRLVISEHNLRSCQVVAKSPRCMPVTIDSMPVPKNAYAPVAASAGDGSSGRYAGDPSGRRHQDYQLVFTSQTEKMTSANLDLTIQTDDYWRQLYDSVKFIRKKRRTRFEFATSEVHMTEVDNVYDSADTKSPHVTAKLFSKVKFLKLLQQEARRQHGSAQAPKPPSSPIVLPNNPKTSQFHNPKYSPHAYRAIASLNEDDVESVWTYVFDSVKTYEVEVELCSEKYISAQDEAARRRYVEEFARLSCFLMYFPRMY